MKNRLEGSRAGLALIASGVLVLAMFAFFANPTARAQGNPPDVECASSLWNGGYWKVQVNDGSLAGVETNVANDAIDPISLVDGTVTWENNHSTDYVFRIVRKSGQTISSDIEGLWGPGEGGTFSVPQDISHITFCFTEAPTTTTEATTTTTEATTTTTEATTTTTEATTTTTEATTTTTEATTTTTAPSTTTSSIPDEVEGTVITTTTVPDEVLDTEVTASTLPFTGGENEHLAMFALALLGSGMLIVLGVRSLERSGSS